MHVFICSRSCSQVSVKKIADFRLMACTAIHYHVLGSIISQELLTMLMHLLYFLCISLTTFLPVNLPFSLVLLLGCSTCPWCHYRLCSVRSFGQADVHDDDPCCLLHPAVLLPATQGASLYYLHIPYLQCSGCSWLFLHVSNIMTGFIWMNTYNFECNYKTVC